MSAQEPIDIRFRVGGKRVHIHIEDDEVAGAAPRAHSPDFRSVTWDGSKYHFSPMQATVVRVLWQAWENGTPDVAQETLIEAADSSGNRLRDLFRKNPAWGFLIVPGEVKGAFRLDGADEG